MADTNSLNDRAERLNRRRARMMPVLALFLIIQQASFFSSGDRLRTVDMVRNAGWIALALVVLAGLLTGGFWFRSPEVRALLEDEVTCANRARALTLGFAVAIGAGIVLFALESFAPGSATTREAIHIVVSFGLAAALLRFGYLERRALA